MIKYILFIFFFIFNSHLYAETYISIASTTSTHDTGLLKHINKYFTEEYNIKVNVLSLGTGQAIRTAEDGNVEILIVHHLPSELEFINKGYGALRYNLMYNDFILVGPKEDENSCISIKKKFNYISKNKLLFVSRGDDSGTHKKEKELWEQIDKKPNINDFWYLSIGQGMGQTLLLSNNKKAYTLTDRGTWISFNQKDNLKIICENTPPLINQYGVILIDKSINKNIKYNEGKKYINWIISNKAKKLINNYKINGEQLFFFNNN